MRQFKHLDGFRSFLFQKQINEKISINKDVELLSERIFIFLRNKEIGKYNFDLEIPEEFNIKKNNN